MDVIHENPLVFGHIPFDLQVQAVIHMVVNLLRFPVSPEKPVQDPHPGHLLGIPSIGSTLPLPYAHMAALLSGQGIFLAAGPAMASHRLPIISPSDQLPDRLTGVGVGGFVGLIERSNRPPFYHRGGHWRQASSVTWAYSADAAAKGKSSAVFLRELF